MTESMSQTVAASKHRKTQKLKTVQKAMTLEEEIMSLHALAPRTLNQLPGLFAESVVDSSNKVLGEATGEAFIRCIGDKNLNDPDHVYERLESFLQGGSDEMKKAIIGAFRARVHRLYKLTMDVSLSVAKEHLVE